MHYVSGFFSFCVPGCTDETPWEDIKLKAPEFFSEPNLWKRWQCATVNNSLNTKSRESCYSHQQECKNGELMMSQVYYWLELAYFSPWGHTPRAQVMLRCLYRYQLQKLYCAVPFLPRKSNSPAELHLLPLSPKWLNFLEENANDHVSRVQASTEPNCIRRQRQVYARNI